MKKIKVLFLSLCLLFPVLIAFPQSKGIHLSWNGEKKTNTAKTIAITWMNDNRNAAMVRYGTDSNNLVSAKPAEAKYSNDLHTYAFKITLKGLRPSSSYFYQVGSEQEGWSKVFHFKTAPPVGDNAIITVGVWGDTQNNEGNLNFEQTGVVVNQMVKYPLLFTIHMGDIAENGSVENNWKGFFNIAQPLNANFPFMSVTGNHDVVNDHTAYNFQKPFPIYYDLFNLPHDNLNYSYDYGNTHFVAINSGFAKGAEKTDEIFFKKGSPEYRWLDADLANARKNKLIKWVILYCHYPMYAYGVSLVPAWQGRITPLLDKYQVDLCLSGHRHVYERHKAIKGNEILEQKDIHVYNNPEGTVYITNGSAGGSLQGIGGNNQPDMIYTPDEKVYVYAIMTIDDKNINYDVYTKEGKKIDYFKISK